LFLQGYFFKKSIFLLRLSYKKFVSKKNGAKRVTDKFVSDSQSFNYFWMLTA